MFTLGLAISTHPQLLGLITCVAYDDHRVWRFRTF
jgi:hypothetical protein